MRADVMAALVIAPDVDMLVLWEMSSSYNWWSRIRETMCDQFLKNKRATSGLLQ